MFVADRFPPKYIPVVGDGVILPTTGTRAIVRGLNTDTHFAREHNMPEKDAPLVSAQVSLANGTLEDWTLHRFYRESFFQYLFRPTGMGRWKWPGTICWYVISLAIFLAGLFEPIPEVGWRVATWSFMPLVWATVVYMHWRQYTRRTV